MNQSSKPQKLKHVIALLVVMTTMLTSCTPSEPILSVEIGDGGFLSQEPCGPPCFMGITPGVTTESNALRKTAELYDLKECSAWEATSDGAQKGVRCESLAILFDNANIVTVVSFTPQQTITVEEAISRYGAPDAVGTAPLISDYEHSPTVSLILYYREYSMDLSLPVQEGYQYELTPETEIKSIMYYDKESYNRHLEFTQPWKGFGPY